MRAGRSSSALLSTSLPKIRYPIVLRHDPDDQLTRNRRNAGAMEFRRARSFAPVGALLLFKPLLDGLVERL
jgi:hypothetical protein